MQSFQVSTNEWFHKLDTQPWQHLKDLIHKSASNEYDQRSFQKHFDFISYFIHGLRCWIPEQGEIFIFIQCRKMCSNNFVNKPQHLFYVYFFLVLFNLHCCRFFIHSFTICAKVFVYMNIHSCVKHTATYYCVYMIIMAVYIQYLK